MHLGTVTKLRIPVTTSLGYEIQDIVDGGQQVEAALLDVVRHRRVGAVEVAQRADTVPTEYGYRRILVPLAVFAAQIVLERAGAATQESQPVPASRAAMLSQGWRIGRSNNGDVNILGEVMSHTVQAVYKKCAHRARAGLLLSVHEVVDQQGPV